MDVAGTAARKLASRSSRRQFFKFLGAGSLGAGLWLTRTGVALGSVSGCVGCGGGPCNPCVGIGPICDNASFPCRTCQQGGGCGPACQTSGEWFCCQTSGRTGCRIEALAGRADERHCLREENAHRVTERDRLLVGPAGGVDPTQRRAGQLDGRAQRQRRELLALSLGDRLRLARGELLKVAHELVRVASERESERTFHGPNDTRGYRSGSL